MNPPTIFHGFVCGKVTLVLGGYIHDNDLGYFANNDTGIITKRDPDSLRGADFAYFSYQRLPKGTLPSKGYGPVVPDLVVEVKSPSDRWKDIFAKVAEYLNAGISVVCVFDPERTTVTVYQADSPEQTFTADQTLTLPTVLPSFAALVRGFFE